MLELLVLAIAPAVFLLWYVLRKDCYEPEPKSQVVRMFFLGALMVIPAAVIEYPFPPGIILSSVIAPVVEEILKFSIVFFFVYRLSEFNEPMDGIVYAAAAGLGFAAVENIVYVLEGGIAVGIFRAIASVPGHMIFSCTWGYALGIAKFRPEQARGGIIATGLAAAILLHGTFNFSLEYFELGGLLFIVVLLIPSGWWFTQRNIRMAHADPQSGFSKLQKSSCNGYGQQNIMNPEIVAGTVLTPQHPISQDRPMQKYQNQNQKYTVHYCTHCGTKYPDGSRFCTNCGKEL